MLVAADAAQLEWRTALFLSQDQVGIQEIKNNEDVHEKNRVAFSLPSRLIAKIYLFRTIFRGSGYAFSIDNDFKHVSDDPNYWDNINTQFYKKYSGLNAWHHSLSQVVAMRKPIVSPFGREWLIEPEIKAYTDRFGNVSNKEVLPWTKFTNYPVQGTGADIMTVARLSMNARLKKLKLKSLWVVTVHDSLVLDCPEDEWRLVGKILYEVFDDLTINIKKLFNVDLLIPFPCEVKYGESLFNMTKIKYEDL